MLPLQRFLVLLIGLLAIVGPASLSARTDEAIRVISSEARPDFPTAISFVLEAEAPAEDLSAVRLLYGAARSETLTIVDLPVAPGRRASLEHRLDTQVYYFPPGSTLVFRWEISDVAGNKLTTAPQEVVYHDDRLAWSERSEQNLTIYWSRGGESFGDELMAASLDALERLEAIVGARLEHPVRIYVYPNIRDMQGALEVNSEEWVGGAAWPDLGVIVGAIAPGDTPEIARLIPHELSHQVLHQATENPYGGLPVWFDEGLAVHIQAQRDIGWDELVTEAAETGRLIALEALAASFPADPEQAVLSYAQSRDVVEYILEVYGEEQFHLLVQAFAEATPVEQALPEVLGVTVDELDAAWRATLPPQQEEPPVSVGPQTAPPDRFGDTALGAQSDAGTPGGVAAWVRGLAGLPAWATVGAAALCCVVVIAAVGMVLLFVLRLLGVDKRTM